MPSQAVSTISFKIDPQFRNLIADLANIEERSMTGFIKNAIKHYILERTEDNRTAEIKLPDNLKKKLEKRLTKPFGKDTKILDITNIDSLFGK